MGQKHVNSFEYEKKYNRNIFDNEQDNTCSYHIKDTEICMYSTLLFNSRKSIN